MTKIKYNQNYKSKIRFKKTLSIRFFTQGKIANQNSATKTNTFNKIPNQEPMTPVCDTNVNSSVFSLEHARHV